MNIMKQQNLQIHLILLHQKQTQSLLKNTNYI